MEQLALIIAIADALIVISVGAHVIIGHKEPIAKAFWIFLLISMPFIGALCYAVFGIISVNKRMQRRLGKRLAERNRWESCDDIQRWQREFAADARYRSIVKCHALLLRLNQRPPVTGNTIEMHVGGGETYRRLLDDIAAANSSIHLETYILAADAFGRELAQALGEAARRGVEVRVLYDAIGSIGLSDRFVDGLNASGVRAEAYGHINPLKRRTQINLRNHRKVWVIDGRIGYAGGLNLHAENSPKYCRQPRGAKQKVAPVHDYHFRCTGPVVAQLQEVFAEDWYMMTDETLIADRYFPAAVSCGNALMRVISAGPGAGDRVFSRTCFAAISAAEKEIIAVTPYFYPDSAILEAFKTAALAGVAVHLILPRRSDHRFVSRAAHSLFPELVAAGVKVYRRKFPFIHSKAMLIDRSWALVGSANLDARSLHLNYETNLEVVEDAFCARLRRELQQEMDQSQLVTAATLAQWGVVHRFKNNFCALFAPIL